MNKLSQFKETNCTCQECISYCKTHPGWFRPKEISRLTKFLDMSFQKAFEKYLIADYWIGEDEDIYLLSPVKDFDKILSRKANTREERLIKETIIFQLKHNDFMGRDCDRAGSYASWGYAFLKAPCIFLENDRCKIYPVRPFECKTNWHRMDPKKDNVRPLIAEEWKGNRLIEKLCPFLFKNES